MKEPKAREETSAFYTSWFHNPWVIMVIVIVIIGTISTTYMMVSKRKLIVDAIKRGDWETVSKIKEALK
jgi:uncharacterized membrane protein